MHSAHTHNFYSTQERRANKFFATSCLSLRLSHPRPKWIVHRQSISESKKNICAEKLFESKYFTHGKVVFGFIDFRLECFQHCFELPMLRLCDGADDNFTWNIANFPWCHRSPDCEMRLCGPVNSTWVWEETRHKHKRQPYYNVDNNDREYDKNTYKRESLWRPSR